MLITVIGGVIDVVVPKPPVTVTAAATVPLSSTSILAF